MKKILFALVLALVLILSISPVVLAADPIVVDVQVSPIVVVDSSGNPVVTSPIGSPLTASGTVTITSQSGAPGFPAHAEADSNAYYGVTDPNGGPIDGGSYSVSDSHWAFFYVGAIANQMLSWSSTFTPTVEGGYVVEQGGTASAEWDSYFLWWHLAHGEDSDTAENSATITAYRPTIPNPVIELWFDRPDTWFDDSGNVWYINNGSGIYTLVIPPGATPPGIDFLTITFIGGVPVFNLGGCDIQFSQPLTLFVWIGGVPFEVATFSQIVGGHPVPLP